MNAPITFSTDKLDSSAPSFTFSTEKGINGFRATMNWESDQDIDISAVGLDVTGRCTNFAHLSYYGWIEMVAEKRITAEQRAAYVTVNQDGTYSSKDGGITHSPDVRNGSFSKVDEWIEWLLSKIPADVYSYAILASAHTKSGMPIQVFGSVVDAVFTLSDDSGTPLKRYTLNRDFGNARVVVLGILTRTAAGPWEFQPKGDASPNHELGHALKAYGVPM